MDQRSIEWFNARLGKVTASRVADVIAKTKTGVSTSRANYMAELLIERLTGTKQDGFTNADMQRGIDLEPIAVSIYEIGRKSVEPVGFIEHPTINMSGASPDGLVELDGQIEVKCPRPANHLDTLRNEKIPSKYVSQVQWQLACTGRHWCDFVSYCPDFDLKMQLKVIRVKRDDDYIAMLESEVTSFLNELDLLEKEIRGKYYGES